MSKELDDKREQLEELQREVTNLAAKERNDRNFPEMKKLEGTYWKCRNSFSGSGEESDSWWLYRYIKEVRPDGIMVTMDFQVDKYGEIRMDRAHLLPWATSRHLETPSNCQEWFNALCHVRSAVSEMTDLAG